MFNHKVTFGIFLAILFIRISSLDSEAIKKDISLCSNNKNTNTCSSVHLYTGYYHCCKLTSETVFSSISFCSALFIGINKIWELKTTKALNKEIFGITKYRYGYEHDLNPDYIKLRLIYECIDGKSINEFGYDTYTSEDIEILQSDEHCLNYIYNNRIFSSKEECYDSVLLPSSKDVGLSCGYFKYTLKYSDGSSDEIESCGIFNRDLIKQKNIDDKSKESYQSFINSNKDEGKIVVSFEANLSNKEGQYIVYDSVTDSITSSNSKKNLTLNYLLFLTIILLI